jgi:hypothetical protein
MDVRALTVKAVHDGPVCTVILCGDLDLAETDGFVNGHREIRLSGLVFSGLAAT